MNAMFLLIAIALAINSLPAETIEVTIFPKMAQIAADDGNIAITCESSSVLKYCQFQISTEQDSNKWNWQINSTGDGTKLQKTIYGDAIQFDYSFKGVELGEDRCVLHLSSLLKGRYFVGCRVQSHWSGWKYDHMALTVTDGCETIEYKLKNTPDFREVAVKVNVKSSEIEFKASEKLNRCGLYFPDQGNKQEEFYNLHENNSDLVLNSKSGRFESNSCKASITPEDFNSGLLWCTFMTSPRLDCPDFSSFDLAIIQTLVEPKLPKLTQSISQSPIGQTVTARCSVDDARPVPRIVWTLGCDVIRNDTDDDDVDRAWSWPWDVKSTTQVLTLNLTEEDSGKKLTCKVFYPNASVFWRAESFVVVTRETSVNIFENYTGIVISVVIVILVLSLVAVIVFLSLRGKCARAKPRTSRVF